MPNKLPNTATMKSRLFHLNKPYQTLGFTMKAIKYCILATTLVILGTLAVQAKEKKGSSSKETNVETGYMKKTNPKE